jgi:hypothetical protein
VTLRPPALPLGRLKSRPRDGEPRVARLAEERGRRFVSIAPNDAKAAVDIESVAADIDGVAADIVTATVDIATVAADIATATFAVADVAADVVTGAADIARVTVDDDKATADIESVAPDTAAVAVSGNAGTARGCRACAAEWAYDFSLRPLRPVKKGPF